MADGEDGDGPLFLDLEECDIAGVSERDQQFTEERIFRQDFAATERKITQEPYSLRNRIEGSVGSRKVLFDQEAVKA